MRILYHVERLLVLQDHLTKLIDRVTELTQLNKWALKDQISSEDYENLVREQYCYIRTILKDIIA